MLAGGISMGYKDGVGSSAEFSYPGGIAVDAEGNVYVADMGNSAVRKIRPDGTVTTLAGQPGVAGGGTAEAMLRSSGRRMICVSTVKARSTWQTVDSFGKSPGVAHA
jgi:DNA-binding beta-propeller fold protein YncE